MAADQPIEEQDTVEVIDFVLGDTCLEALHLEGDCLPFEVLGRQLDGLGADHLAGVVRDRQTALTADGKPLPVGDHGIDQHQWPMVVHRATRTGGVDETQTLHPTDLGGGDADGRWTLLGRVLQVFGELAQFRVKLLDRIAGGLQALVWIDEYRQWLHSQPRMVSSGVTRTVSP